MIALITGKPNTGKSTAVRKIIDQLGSLRCCGLLAEEILKDGERVGFETAGISCGEKIVLAHKELEKTWAVEDFGIDLTSLERLAAKEFETGLKDEKTRFIIIDEIGRMQVMSERFRQLLDQVAESSKSLIATICYEDEIEYIRDFKNREDVRLFVLNKEDRDELPLSVCGYVCNDDEEYLSKIALARKYAQERQRYEYLPDKVILHSTHGIRTITKENGHYHCTCDYYQKNGTCSHIMSLFIS